LRIQNYIFEGVVHIIHLLAYYKSSLHGHSIPVTHPMHEHKLLAGCLSHQYADDVMAIK